MPSGDFQTELPRPSPRLDRELDLGTVRTNLSEWPGRRGPLVCLGWPAAELAEVLAPDWRILQVALRPRAPYQAQAAETQALLEVFGFEHVVLLGSGLAAGVALLVAAWEPARVRGLVLVRPRRRPTTLDPAALRAWLDAPLRWPALLDELRCPVLRVTGGRPPRVAEAVRSFLGSTVQLDAWA